MPQCLVDDYVDDGKGYEYRYWVDQCWYLQRPEKSSLKITNAKTNNRFEKELLRIIIREGKDIEEDKYNIERIIAMYEHRTGRELPGIQYD